MKVKDEGRLAELRTKFEKAKEVLEGSGDSRSNSQFVSLLEERLEELVKEVRQCVKEKEINSLTEELDSLLERVDSQTNPDDVDDNENKRKNDSTAEGESPKKKRRRRGTSHHGVEVDKF